MSKKQQAIAGFIYGMILSLVIRYWDSMWVQNIAFVIGLPIIYTGIFILILNQTKTKDMKFTIEEIRKYLQSQDSFGDIFYNLSEEAIIKANQPKEEEQIYSIKKIINLERHEFGPIQSFIAKKGLKCPAHDYNYTSKKLQRMPYILLLRENNLMEELTQIINNQQL